MRLYHYLERSANEKSVIYPSETSLQVIHRFRGGGRGVEGSIAVCGPESWIASRNMWLPAPSATALPRTFEVEYLIHSKKRIYRIYPNSGV